MLNVSYIYNCSNFQIGSHVQINGMLLGARFDNLVVADSIEDYDKDMAMPILDDDLLENMIMCGVEGIGGGRFGYRYDCIISAILSSSARGYKYSLINIAEFAVCYRGKFVSVR